VNADKDDKRKSNIPEFIGVNFFLDKLRIVKQLLF
jgi:hypothetical protein